MIEIDVEKKIKTIENDYSKIHLSNKKDFGEVFTPFPLIEIMLGYLPTNVWTNPNLKWLDPTAGIGNFMLIIYAKLMNGLQKWEPNRKKRSAHILTKMLFIIEINIQNVRIAQTIFGKKSNILNINFLEFKSEETFQIIIGNPPFQDQFGKGGKNKLYERITAKCIDLLDQTNGYLLFLVPNNIFSGNTSKIYMQFLEENNTINLVNFNKNILDFFPSIQQAMCFFLLEKGGKKNTTIIGNSGEVLRLQLKNRPVNPINNWNTKTESLINHYILNTKNNFIYNRGLALSNYSFKKEKYSLIYKANEFLYTNKKELAVGLGVKKIIIFLISTKLEFKVDYEGIYGVGPNIVYLPFDYVREGKKLELFFKGEDYTLMSNATRTTRQFLKMALLQYLNIDLIVNK